MIGSFSGPWCSGGLHGKLLVSLVTPSLMLWLHGYNTRRCTGEMQTNADDGLTTLRVMVVSGNSSLLLRGNRIPFITNGTHERFACTLRGAYISIYSLCKTDNVPDMPPVDYVIVICVMPSQNPRKANNSPLRPTAIRHPQEVIDDHNSQRPQFSQRFASPTVCKHELPPAVFCC